MTVEGDSMQNTEGRLVSRTEIAAMAGVGRSAVTNWERRHADFPKARRAGEQDYFRLSDIVGWLDTRRVPKRDRRDAESEGITYGDRVRASPQPSSPGYDAWLTTADENDELARPRSQEALGALAKPSMARRWGARTPADYLPLPLSLAFLRWAAPERFASLKQLVRSRPPATPGRFIEQVGIEADRVLRASGVVPSLRTSLQRLAPMADVRPAQVLSMVEGLDRAAFRELLDLFAQDARLSAQESFTPKGVVDLLSRTVMDLPGEPSATSQGFTVNDPYPRGGELLAAVVASMGASSLFRVRADAPNNGMLRMTAMNLMIHDCVPHLDSHEAPWLTMSPGDRGSSDFALTNPPFNAESGKTGAVAWKYGTPPPSNDNFAWLQHILSTLRPGGRAAVVMADNAAVSDTSKERAIRQAMVEDGVVECVVALPSHLFTGTAVSACVWFLTTPSTRTEVHFVNARRAGAMVSRTRRELQPDDVHLIQEVYRSLRDGLNVPDDERGLGRSVSTQEIKEREYSLSPVDYVDVGTHAVRSPEDVAASWDELSNSLAKARFLDEATQDFWERRTAPNHARPGHPQGWSQSLLRDVCEVQAGPSPSLLNPRMFSPDEQIAVVLPKHLRHRRVSDVVESRISCEEARRLERFLLKEGDILLTRTGTVGPLGLVEAAEAGSLYSGTFIRLHSFARGVDSHFVLAFLALPATQAWIKGRAGMTTVASITTKAVGQLPILLPPPDEQRRIGDILSALDSQIVAHHQVMRTAERAHDDLANLLMEVALPSPGPGHKAQKGHFDE